MKLKKILSPIIYMLLFLSAGNCVFARTATADAGNGTLTGIVTDKADTSSLPGVTVSIPDLKLSTATNEKGKYVLNHVPRGVYLVTFSD